MHPILITIPTPWGGLPIYSYGVMLGTSLIVAWYIVMWLGSTKDGLDKEMMSNCFVATAVCAIIGARVLYIVTNLGEFESPLDWFALRSGGLVAYGGFLGGCLGSYVYLKYKGIPLLPWADAVAPTLGSGLFFTRIGCYLYGCDFGARLPASAPSWLKSLGTFPHWDAPVQDLACSESPTGSPAWAWHVSQYGLNHDAAASYPVHPTQLYESAIGLVLFTICMLVWRVRSFRGQVLFVMTMCYGVWRFFIEYVRDDPERGAAFGFSTSQIISLALIPIAAFFYVNERRKALALGPAALAPLGPLGGEPAEDDAKPSGDRVTKKATPKAKKKKK